MSTCPHVTDLLLDATGPLQPLHARVLEAGCEVNPSWKLGCPSWGVLGAGGPVRLYMQLACWTFRRGPKVYQVKLTNWHSFGYSSLMKYILAFPCNEFVVFFRGSLPNSLHQGSVSGKNDHTFSISGVQMFNIYNVARKPMSFLNACSSKTEASHMHPQPHRAEESCESAVLSIDWRSDGWIGRLGGSWLLRGIQCIPIWESST